MNRNMNIRKTLTITLFVLILVTFFCSPGYAQDRWKFDLVPFFWMAGIEGDVAVKGIESSVDASFSDLFEALDGAFAIHTEARKGKWGLWLEPMYLKLSKDAEAGPVNIGVELQTWLVDFGGLYRLYEKPLGDTEKRILSVDLLAGGRYLSLDQKLEISGGPNAQKSKQWADPIVGGRLITDLTEKLAFTLRGDVGGFGVSSDLTWSVSTFLGYQFTRVFSLWGGYRAFGVDYETGSGTNLFKYDVTQHGPVVSVGFSF